jgi:hypothetical protein
MVLQRCRIGERTLRRYAEYGLDHEGRLDVSSGPRKTDYFIRICEALGESPGLLLWAATVSDSYGAMLHLIESGLSWDPLDGTPPPPLPSSMTEGLAAALPRAARHKVVPERASFT